MTHLSQLTVAHVTKAYAGHAVLEDVSFTVAAGEQAGVIWENGSGKTTFLRVLAGDLAQDAGTARRPERIGYLRQEIPVRRSRGRC